MYEEEILGLTDEQKSVIRALYDGPGRYYHTTAHLDHMLGLFEMVASRLTDQTAVELAIYYHDVIYDPKSANNEADSNARLIADMSGHVDTSTLNRASEMILATTKHALPTGNAMESDCGYFLDIDLSILGAEPSAFDQYEDSIRREYQFVPEANFRSGRADILQRFLERDTLYFTAHFRDLYEEKARSNLQRSLRALKAES